MFPHKSRYPHRTDYYRHLHSQLHRALQISTQMHWALVLFTAARDRTPTDLYIATQENSRYGRHLHSHTRTQQESTVTQLQKNTAEVYTAAQEHSSYLHICTRTQDIYTAAQEHGRLLHRCTRAQYIYTAAQEHGWQEHSCTRTWQISTQLHKNMADTYTAAQEHGW